MRRNMWVSALAVIAGGCLGATLAVPARSAGDTAVNPAGGAEGGAFLYICNQGEATVSVLDMATQTIVETIDLQALGFSENAKPHHVAVEPDGSFWYLSLIGENRVLKFDARNRLVAQAEFEVPGMLVLHPTRDLLVVGRSMSAVNPPQRIGLIQRSDMSVEEVDVFFPRPHAIAISEDGRFVYTASLGVNQVASVELDTERLELTSFDGPTHTLVQFAVSPDGLTMVGTAQLTGRLLLFDLTDPAHPALTGDIQVAEQPWHPVFTPDGRTVYFGNKTANEISIVDLPSRSVVGRLQGAGISAPHGSAVSPDGRFVYISSNGAQMSMDPGAAMEAAHGSVVVIDTARREVVEVVHTGMNTTGLGAAAPPGG